MKFYGHRYKISRVGTLYVESVRSETFLTFTFRILGVFVNELKKANHARNKKLPACYMPANCAEISKVTSGGGNWILRDLGPPEAKAFDRNIIYREPDTT